MTRTYNRVLKQCSHCGHKVQAFPRERVCKQSERSKTTGFTTGYRCPGKLVPVAALRRAKQRAKRAAALPPVPKGLGIGHVLSEDYAKQVMQRAVDNARTKANNEYAHALEKQKEWLAESERIEKLCRKWTKEVRRLKTRVGWSDAQFAEERRRMARAAQVSAVKKRLVKSAGITKEQQQ